MKIGTKCMLTGMLVLLAVLAMAAPAAADPWIGGDPLVTANGTNGTVSGDLWFDAYPGFASAYTTPVTKTFTLPCDAGNVTWARLYVDTYIGHMQNNYPLNTTVEFNGGSGYETLGSEIMNTSYTFPEDNGSDGTVWINDHCNRVTSDCLMWYDVKDNISSSSVAARVHTAKPDGTRPLDGRVKMITLVVAYNNASSGKTVHYWVNQGHDTDSYVADDWECFYIGNTTFSTSGITALDANLTAIYLASYNGNYTFNNNALPWSNPGQGSYFGYQSWNVTSYINGNSFMTFDRNATDSGSYSGYFKIPLALLTVEDPKITYDFSGNSRGEAGTDLYAYEGAVGAQPPGSSTVPSTAISTSAALTVDNGTYEYFNTTNNGDYAAQRFVFGIDENASAIDGLNVTWNGRGYHDDNSMNGTYLYIWNNSTGSYQELSNTSSGSDTTLSGEVTSNIGTYIVSGDVTVLAVQKSAQYVDEDTLYSRIATDYVKLVVDRKV